MSTLKDNIENSFNRIARQLVFKDGLILKTDFDELEKYKKSVQLQIEDWQDYINKIDHLLETQKIRGLTHRL